MSISIHAPVLGATHDFEEISKRSFISIHAPVWGTTGLIAQLVASLVLTQFQISHCCYRKSITGPLIKRERSRVVLYIPVWYVTQVLINTPVRGAMYSAMLIQFRDDFNPRTCVGATRRAIHITASDISIHAPV